MAKKKITLKDIAEATGTSVSTVSLAIRDDPRISAPVRKQIQTTAKQLGFRVNLLGAMLRTNTPRIIGVVADLSQELHSRYVKEMSTVAGNKGYQLVTESISTYGNVDAAFQALKRFNVKTSIAINPPLAALRESSIEPQIVIGQEKGPGNADLITSDNSKGMDDLISHLYSLGHREVIYLNGPEGASALARLQALQTACKNHRVKLHIETGGGHINSGYLATMKILADQKYAQVSNAEKQTNVPFQSASALVCYNDHCAQGALIALWKSGINVPRDVSVSGYDNSQVADCEAFDLTSVDRAPMQLAEWAIKRAIARNEGLVQEPDQLKVGTTLVKRSSTGRAFFL